MIVTVLFLVIGGGILTSFLVGRTSYLSSDASVLVQQEARRAFDNMIRELREAGPSVVNPRVPANEISTTNGNKQLNFKIARGYNLIATEPLCPADAVCWGSEDVPNEWVHYALLEGNTSTPNDNQLVRCVDGTREPTISSGAGCRVLANNVKSIVFAYDRVNETIDITVDITYQSEMIPTGSHSVSKAPGLTARVKLRN